MAENLVVYFGPPTINKFKLFLELSKDFMQQDDIEFAHIDTTTYPPSELEIYDLKEF